MFIAFFFEALGELRATACQLALSNVVSSRDPRETFLPEAMLARFAESVLENGPDPWQQVNVEGLGQEEISRN